MDQNDVTSILDSIASLLESSNSERVYNVAGKKIKEITGTDLFCFIYSKNKLIQDFYTPFKQFQNNEMQEFLIKKIKTITGATSHTSASLPSSLQKKGITTVQIIPLIKNTNTAGFLVLFTKKDLSLPEKTISLISIYGGIVLLLLSNIKDKNEAEQKVESRDNYISYASHEIRNPLTSINGYIQLLYLKLANTNTSEARWIKELDKESKKLTSRVIKLLDVKQIKKLK